MLKITECPTCGSGKIKKVRKNLRRETRGIPYVVPRLAFWECPECGERLFDHAAMQKIEAHRPAPSRARRRAKAMPPLTKCPTCGSHKIKRVRRNWTSVYKGQRYTVPRVSFDACPDCGEQVFDPRAVDRIQAHRPTVPDAVETSAEAGRC